MFTALLIDLSDIFYIATHLTMHITFIDTIRDMINFLNLAHHRYSLSLELFFVKVELWLKWIYVCLGV